MHAFYDFQLVFEKSHAFCSSHLYEYLELVVHVTNMFKSFCLQLVDLDPLYLYFAFHHMIRHYFPFCVNVVQNFKVAKERSLR